MCFDSSAVEVWCCIAGWCCDVDECFRGRFVREPRTIQLSVNRANYESILRSPFATHSPSVSDELNVCAFVLLVWCQRSAVAWPDVTEWRKSFADLLAFDLIRTQFNWCVTATLKLEMAETNSGCDAQRKMPFIWRINMARSVFKQI